MATPSLYHWYVLPTPIFPFNNTEPVAQMSRLPTGWIFGFGLETTKVVAADCANAVPWEITTL